MMPLDLAVDIPVASYIITTKNIYLIISDTEVHMPTVLSKFLSYVHHCVYVVVQIWTIALCTTCVTYETNVHVCTSVSHMIKYIFSWCMYHKL